MIILHCFDFVVVVVGMKMKLMMKKKMMMMRSKKRMVKLELDDGLKNCLNVRFVAGWKS